VSDRPLAVGISGSPREPSRSKALLDATLDALSRRGCETTLIDLSLLPADALLARASHADVDDALATVARAKIVVAATPTYRALYTGLLKSFFDLMPMGFLAGKLCVGVQTAAIAEHALAIEYGLRPLFMSLDGVPLAGLFATDDEFIDGKPNATLLERIDGVAERTMALVR
jgi:FMN reductase